jgi:hypothetical protein
MGRAGRGSGELERIIKGVASRRVGGRAGTRGRKEKWAVARTGGGGAPVEAAAAGLRARTRTGTAAQGG